jgi:hypothetical protein
MAKKVKKSLHMIMDIASLEILEFNLHLQEVKIS